MLNTLMSWGSNIDTCLPGLQWIEKYFTKAMQIWSKTVQQLWSLWIYTDVIDSVLSDVFNFRIRWVQRFTFFVILNLLFLCRSRVTEIFGLSVIMMEHGHQKITNKTDTQVKWHQPFQWDQLFCICILYFINCTCFPNNIRIIFITVYSCIIRKISWSWLLNHSFLFISPLVYILSSLIQITLRRN